MMYSSQRAQAIQKKDVAYLSAGIHDNILLDSYNDYKKSLLQKMFI